MRRHMVFAVVACHLALALVAGAADSVGFSDTPFLPGGKWRVHDINRPQPPVVKPGAQPGQAPSDALVLFDGKNLDLWYSMRKGKVVPAGWKVEDGYMEVTKTGTLISKEKFGDCQLHVEWATPAVVKGSSQARGNSGIFLMGRYEIQVLDCHQNRTYADGGAGSVYGQSPPMVNVCRPPGEWQSYDIIFEAPHFDSNKKLQRPAYVTVIQNGVVVQNHQEIIGTTSHKRVGTYSYHEPLESLQLQDHGNPVRYRNIWIRPIKSAE